MDVVPAFGRGIAGGGSGHLFLGKGAAHGSAGCGGVSVQYRMDGGYDAGATSEAHDGRCSGARVQAHNAMRTAVDVQIWMRCDAQLKAREKPPAARADLRSSPACPLLPCHGISPPARGRLTWAPPCTRPTGLERPSLAVIRAGDRIHGRSSPWRRIHSLPASDWHTAAWLVRCSSGGAPVRARGWLPYTIPPATRCGPLTTTTPTPCMNPFQPPVPPTRYGTLP